VRPSRRRALRACRLLSLTLLAGALLPAAAAQAAPYPVTSLADSGANTLRQSILAANSNGGPDTIPIQVSGTIGLASALPDITGEVEISGPGAGLLKVTRAAAADFRIFTAGAPVSISGITISNGRAAQGAGILSQGPLSLRQVVVSGNEAFASGGVQAVAHGGGVYAAGALTLRETTVSGNEANADGASSQTVAKYGGVLAAAGALVDSSTISGNTVEAVSTGSQVVAEAAGVAFLNGPAVVERSTVSANSATAADGSSQTFARGGGISSFGNLTLSSSTITANEVSSTESASAANLSVFGANTIRNTILSAPQGGANCIGGTTTSGGFNIEDGANCGFSLASDRAGVAPGLDPRLLDNGGPTLTHALLSTSIALDTGNAFGAVVDQRGLSRPADLPTVANAAGGDGSDVGAFELQELASAPDNGGGGGGAGPLPIQLPFPLGTGDLTAPTTRIVKGPPRVTRRLAAVFRFTSNEQSTFQCKVDKERFRTCKSPYKLKVAGPGRHLFKVRAKDRAGNTDPTPAQFGWRVKRTGP
jgi:hypothetical protein